MITQLAQDIIVWIGENPSWASFVVLLVALLESLAIVGVAVPGASIIIAAGALVGSGILPLWPILLSAFVGAVIGDALSYWLGYHYKNRIHEIWPFRRYPGILHKGTEFFEKHGGKSVFLGRFVGPIRAIIPTVAGIMHMPPNRFFLVNVLSALAWSPSYLLPGLILGASIEFAAEVGGRLAFLLITILIILILTYWLAKHIYLWLQPWATSAMQRVLLAGNQVPVINFLTHTLVDPDKPETKGLLSWALLIIVLTVLLVNTIMHINQVPLAFDMSLFLWLQELRSPMADTLSVFLSYFVHWKIVLSIAIMVAVFFAAYRCWEALFHWIGAIGFALLAPLILNSQPFYLTNDHKDFFQSFPSLDITLATVTFGFLAAIVNRKVKANWSWLAYTLTALILVAASIAQLLLGIVGFSNLVGSISLALLWVIVMSLAYRRHTLALTVNLRLAGFALTSLLILILGNMFFNLQRDVIAFEPVIANKELGYSRWWESSWKDLPHFRKDFFAAGKHPLNLQFAGDPNSLKSELLKADWFAPLQASFSSSLSWLDVNAKTRATAILPHVHQGRHQYLLMAKELQDKDSLLLVRLWYADTVLVKKDSEDQVIPLWVGNVSKVVFKKRLGFFRVPVTDRNFDDPLTVFLSDIQGMIQKQHSSTNTNPQHTQWDGTLVLLDGGT